MILFWLARRVRRPGIVALVYLFGYCVTQFLLFFVRDNIIVSFLGLNWGLKQAQWTSIVLFILLIPISYIVLRVMPYSKPVPTGEVAATYGIAQRVGAREIPGTSQPENRAAQETHGGALLAPTGDQERN